MKRTFVKIVACATLSLSLSACGGVAQTGSSVQTSGQTIDQSAASEAVDSEPEDAAEVKEYLEGEVAAYPTMMWAHLNTEIDALKAGDTATVKDQKDLISSMARRAASMAGVPSAASDYHQMNVDLCLELMNAANYIYLGSMGTDDSAEYINTAASSIDKASGYLTDLTAALDALMTKYGFESIDNPYMVDSADSSADGTAVQPSPATEASEGTYLVGEDIVSGEYKLTAYSGKTAYMDVTDSSGPDANILVQDVFSSTSYVTVTDGQYLTLRGCSAELR